MFELSVAAKYLLPKWRQLSSSIISLISCLVIGLVVWLILVFFSVTNGLETMWVEKLITLSAPIRITPTDSYSKSWYYQIDAISSNSDYQAKSLSEKLQADETDPYEASIDEEIPGSWPAPLLDSQGEKVDLVKELFATIDEQKELFPFQVSTYEGSQAQLKLKSERLTPSDGSLPTGQFEERDLEFSQIATILSLDPENALLDRTLLPIKPHDIGNLKKLTKERKLQEALNESVTVTYETPPYGWVIPPTLYPKEGKLLATPISSRGDVERYLLKETPLAQEIEIKQNIQLIAEGQIPVAVTGNEISFTVQGVKFQGAADPSTLQVASFETLLSDNLPWIHKNEEGFQLPYYAGLGDGILLPKGFRDQGAKLGDRGVITYESPSMTVNQRTEIPIFVAGFYDQGIMALGGKFLIAPREIASYVRTQTGADLVPESNGVHLRFENFERADELKASLTSALRKRGLDRYFLVESYRDFDYIRPFLQELQSQKNLFTILAAIIIMVACSNIISMLIILVNDKRHEIGILRSMGASTLSIASIFGFAGLMMGLIGSLIGVAAAIFTLDHISWILGLLSQLQGHPAFGALFFGDHLPSSLSFEALRFVIIATSITSLLSGLVPAIKACLVKPAITLRS